MANEFIARNGITSLGNIVVSGSITTTGTVAISGSFASASFAATASSADNFLTRGTLTAQTLVVQTITSSVDFVTGSTRFGSIAANTHQFTGSVSITGSLAVVTTGTEFQVNSTGVNLGNALTDSHVISGSLRVNPNGLFVSSSGNVGIGTSSPQRTLEVVGTIRNTNPSGSNFSQMYNDATGAWFGTDTYPMMFETNGAERMRITASGSVGIGTSSPTGSYGKLTVAGGIQITNDNNAKLEIGRYSSGASNSYIKIGSGSNSLRITNAADSIDLVTITNGGTVLINTTSTGSYTNKFILNDAALATGSNGGWFFLDRSNAANTFGWYSTNNTAHLWNGSINIISATAAGLVGIGTDTPTSPLTIKSTSKGDMLRLSISGASAVSDATGITFGSATYDKAQIIAYNENTGNASGYLTFWTGGSPATTDMTERMRITSAGQVYVGGTSITNGSRFGIIGGGVWDGATLGLQNTGTSGQTYTIFSTNSSFSQGAGNLLFYNNNTPSNVLIINSNGNYDFLGSDVSDRRLKQDIENVNFGLNEIMQLSPKSYHLKSQDNLSGENVTTLRKRYGFIAQEVQTILPDTITGTETETEYLGLDYNGVLAVAVKAIQELTARVQYLENK